MVDLIGMIESTRGFVFKTLKYSETSVITKIYTERFGLQSYIVQGVRSSRARGKANLLQPFTLLDLVVYKREARNLQRIKEFKFAHIYQTIPFDFAKRSVAIFLTELLNRSIQEEDEENPELFQFIWERFIKLDEESTVTYYHLDFMLGLSKVLGFYPSGSFSEKDRLFDMQEGVFTSEFPQHPVFLEGDLANSFSSLVHSPVHELRLEKPVRRELMYQLIRYYKLHIPGFGDMNSPEILETVLSGE